MISDKLPETRWWTTAPGSAHTVLVDLVESLQRNYGNVLRSRCADLMTLYQGTQWSPSPLFSWAMDGLSYNAIQVCSDTMIAAVTHNRVNPMILTNAGSTADKRFARGMQRAIEAQFREAKIYGSEGERICSDGVVFGASWVYVWPDTENMRVVYERAFPWEILAHPRDARMGHPRTIHFVTGADRSVLLAAYGSDPKAAEAIRNADTIPLDEFDQAIMSDCDSDRIRVIRSWHLPSTSIDRDNDDEWSLDTCSHDGRASVCIGNMTVSDSAWPYDRFPLCRFSPKLNSIGIHGRGIPDQLVSLQLSLTRTSKRIDGLLQLHAVPLIYVNQKSGINPQRLQRNDWGRIIQGNLPPGQAMQFIVPGAVPAELIQQEQRLIERSRQVTGQTEMSQVSATPNVESGIARQLILDTENVRHTPTFRSWEDFHCDLAYATADCFRVLAEHAKASGKDFKLMFYGDRELEEIDWAETDLGELRTRIAVWPTNLLAKSPTMKLQQILEMMREGLITADQALSKLDFPDFDDTRQEASAARAAAESKVERAANGEVVVPDAYDDLILLLRVAKADLNERELYEPDSEATDRVRQLAEDTIELLEMEERKKLTSAQLQATGAVPSDVAAPTTTAPSGAPAIGQPPVA